MTPFKLPDRYVRTSEYYEGGQGVVWIYHDTDLDRKVAVKFLKPFVSRNELLQEIASLRSIRSKHVAQIYDLQFHPKTNKPALIQEYVSGPDLLESARAGVETRVALHILYQIASGVADVHSAGKIHRDIKPINIKRDAEGIVKLLDFGLACDIDPQPDTSQARGTAAFRAPELYGPVPVTLTPAIDVYAFGVTAWVLLSYGALPVELKSIPPQLPAPTFSSLKPDLPHEIASVLDATLSASPGSRPAMSTVRRILSDHLLFGRHRALISQHDGAAQKILSTPGFGAKLTAGSLFIVIAYDGFKFKIQEVSHGVLINNASCLPGDVMPQSCVITMGIDMSRIFYLFDMSHPEVVL